MTVGPGASKVTAACEGLCLRGTGVGLTFILVGAAAAGGAGWVAGAGWAAGAGAGWAAGAGARWAAGAGAGWAAMAGVGWAARARAAGKASVVDASLYCKVFL